MFLGVASGARAQCYGPAGTAVITSEHFVYRSPIVRYQPVYDVVTFPAPPVVYAPSVLAAPPIVVHPVPVYWTHDYTRRIHSYPVHTHRYYNGHDYSRKGLSLDFGLQIGR